MFTINKFPVSADGWLHDGLVSMTTLVRLSRGRIQSVEDIPMKAFYVRVRDDASTSAIDSLKTALEDAVKTIPELTVWDFRKVIEPINAAVETMNFYMELTGVVAMAVCFFGLLSAMYLNVAEQAKEIAIQRAVGVRLAVIYRIHIYEAIAVVMSSCLLGCMIGAILMWSIVLQSMLFMQIGVPLWFPWGMLSVIVPASIVFGALAAVVPVWRQSRTPIAFLLR